MKQAALAREEAVASDMRRVKDEWERRLQEEQVECQRVVVEMQAKHAMHIKSMQGEYQAIMEAQLAKIEREQKEEVDKLKKECGVLREREDRIEYIKIERHEQIINEELAKAGE